jgi:hypothetical protein
LIFVALTACVGATDPVWQLDHDRVVAVRISPPHLASGARATVDALIAHHGAPADVLAPAAVIASPDQLAALAAAVQADGSIVAPDDATLEQARASLGLPSGAPVPLEIGASFGGLLAIKTVYLGDAADNPALPAIVVNGAAPTDGATIELPFDADVPLSAAADPTWKVSWLTSCGTMHDDDEHAAFVHVQPDDPTSGQLAVVVRDPLGGVVWGVWSVASAAP